MNPVAIARRRAEREAFHAASPALKAQLLRVHRQANLRPARSRPGPSQPPTGNAAAGVHAKPRSA